MPRFDYLTFHPNFEDHQAAAGRPVVTEGEAEEVWQHRDRSVVPNRKFPGRYLMEGLTRGGRPVTVVLLPTDDPTEWMAYTAW